MNLTIRDAIEDNGTQEEDNDEDEDLGGKESDHDDQKNCKNNRGDEDHESGEDDGRDNDDWLISFAGWDLVEGRFFVNNLLKLNM